jgi:drug/metabolite transporter (DMT)-like permease
MSNSRLSYLYAGLAVFFWSTIATAFKLALEEISPPQLVLIASLTSVGVLSIIAFISGSFKDIMASSWRDISNSIIMGLLNPMVYYLILLKAYTLLPAQVAQPLNMIWPIVLVFLSVPLLGHKIPTRSFLALFISFAGVYLITSQGRPFSPGESNLTGVLLAMGSSIFWALYFILNVRDKRKAEVKLLLNFFFASVYVFIFLIFTGGLEIVSIKGLSLGVYIGIFEMGLTFFLWLKAMSLSDRSDRISNLVFLAPFLSLIFITLILKEGIHYTTIAGLIIIVLSLIFQNMGTRTGKTKVLDKPE